MARQDFTTTGLLARLKRKGMLPANQETFSDADLLLTASEVLRDKIYKVIKSLQEDFFLYTKDFTGVTEFDIPQDAHGGALKGVYNVNASQDLQLPRLTIAQRADGTAQYSRHWGYWIDGNTIKTEGEFASTDFQIRYIKRPGHLVAASEGGKVVSSTATTIVLDTAPSGFSNTASYDVQDPESPFRTKDTFAATNWDSGTKTLTVAATSDITYAVDDWVTLTKEAVIPQIMEEAHALLDEATLIRLFADTGMTTSMERRIVVYNSTKADLDEILNPRVSDSPKKIVSKRGVFRA